MHAPRILAAAATFAACLFVQACSESGDSETSEGTSETVPGTPQGLPAPPRAPLKPQGVDACSLLTVQNVAQAIGHDMDGPETGPTAGGGQGEGKMSSCSFASSSGSANAAPAELLAELSSTWFVNITVWVWPPDGEGAQNYIDAMRDAPMTDEPVREFDGLAEEAVWNGTLHARRGDTTVSVDVRPPASAENPQEVAKERALMEQALEQL